MSKGVPRMRCLTIFVAILVLGSLGTPLRCGQANSPAERQEKQAGVEEAGKEEGQTFGPTTPAATTTGTTTMSTAEADAAKAAAAEQEITLEQLAQLDDSNDYDRQIIVGLFNCQSEKYIADHGRRAYDRLMEDKINRIESDESYNPSSYQRDFIEMGYSCTVPEAMAGTPQ